MLRLKTIAVELVDFLPSGLSLTVVFEWRGQFSHLGQLFCSFVVVVLSVCVSYRVIQLDSYKVTDYMVKDISM